MTLTEKIIPYVSVAPSGCWLWSGCTGSGGYGRVSVGGKQMPAHRFIYELLIGEIPHGLQLDHLCRVRNCVNPSHLEPVTGRVNILRGEGPCAQHARKTHCPQGHPYDAANTYLHKGKYRYCRICLRLNKRRYYAEGREHAVRYVRDQKKRAR